MARPTSRSSRRSISTGSKGVMLLSMPSRDHVMDRPRRTWSSNRARPGGSGWLWAVAASLSAHLVLLALLAARADGGASTPAEAIAVDLGGPAAELAIDNGRSTPSLDELPDPTPRSSAQATGPRPLDAEPGDR